ncbi:MAG: AAA family ATPase [Phycisphaerae bacterium]
MRRDATRHWSRFRLSHQLGVHPAPTSTSGQFLSRRNPQSHPPALPDVVRFAAENLAFRGQRMRLTHINTSARVGTVRAWRASVDLGQKTLLVGRNATGKSMILASMHNLSRMIAKKQRFDDANFDATFANGEKECTYSVTVRGGTVERESFKDGGEEVLTRRADGTGNIKAVAASESRLDFQVPNNELAVVAKRDLIQHPFLEPLHSWAASTRFYRFNEFNQRAFAIVRDGAPEADPSDFNQSVGLFRKGVKTLGDSFKKAVVDDLTRIGYPTDDVGFSSVEEIQLPPEFGAPLLGLYVKERDLRGPTSQFGMSDGMFRALALIIHAAYAELASVPGCMMIDDIGEGLDFERSTALIQLLLERANRKAIQLVMSTNDRFAMNAVPLEVWCGLRRTPDGVETVTERSHPDVFEQFRLTGLNNFDFFKMDYFEVAVPNG